MSVDREAARRRIPLSPYSPRADRHTHTRDGGLASQVNCPRCGDPLVYIAPRPEHDCSGAFTGTHSHNVDDSAAIATINARARHVADDVARSHSPGFGAFATTDDARTAAGHD